MPNSLTIKRLWKVDDPDVARLVEKSDRYLEALYPPESNHAEDTEALVTDNSAFFVGYLDEELVACGATKILDDDGTYGEIKRVFVEESQRGKNLATELMAHLEEHLRDSGISIARLETGPKQPEAISFYRKLGYRERGPFGRYMPDPLSVFMEKVL